MQHWKILVVVFILLGDLETLHLQNPTVTLELIGYSLINGLVSSILGIRASQLTLVVNSSPTNAADTRDVGSIPGSGRSPGRGKVAPLQYSCLENPMGRGAWRATAHGVARVRHDPRCLAHPQLWNKLDFCSYYSSLAQGPDFFISLECLLGDVSQWNQCTQVASDIQRLVLSVLLPYVAAHWVNFLNNKQVWPQIICRTEIPKIS